MGLRRRGPRSQAKDLSETEKVKKGVLTEIHLLEDFLALCAACIASVAMGNHQGNKNSSLLNNLEFESACQRGNGLSCSASPQSTFHISPRALRTSFKGRKSRRLTIMNTLNVEKRLQSITEQRFDTTELLPRSASDTIKEGNEQYSSQILDFASGFKTSLVLSSRTHSTEGQTSNLTFSETTEYTRNSEMANDLSDYDDELYVGNWSIEDRFESLQGEIDPQCNLAIGLKELALPMKDVMVKESLWDHQSTPLKVRMKVGQLEGIIECNSIIPLDQLRGCLDSPEQTSTASGLIHTDDKLPISEIKDINQEEFLPMEKLQFLGEDMDQSLQRALKAGAHFAHYGEDCEGIRGPQMEQMSLVWTRDPETVNQEPIYIFQMTPVMSTQSKPERKTTSSCSAFIYLLSSSNGLGSTPPLGSCCSSDHSIPMLQHHVLPLHKEERGEGNKTQLIAEKSPGVDGSSFSGSVSFLDSLNNNQTSQTFTTMLVSITAGEDMSLLDQNDCAPQYKSVVQSFTCHHSDFLRTTPAEHDIISDLLTSPELELTSFESEERTPGRLQAVWPPPKPKDKEEKIGLKYTEAEHQAALLQLKRECKEEVESLEADFKLQLFRLREENAESVSRLQTAIAELKEKAKRSHSDLRDVAVSTEDNVTPRAFRTVCIQTDRETFIKPVEDAELSSGLCPQPVVPKKLDLTSINLSLSGKHPEAKQHLPPSLALPSPPPPPPLPVQSESETNRAPPPPPSLSGHCDSNEFSKVDKSLDRHLPLEKGSGPPPPPPPPPMAGCGLPPPPPPIPGSAPSPPTGVGLLLSKGEEWPQRKPRVEPVCPMKPLYWTRIQVQNNRNDTLWSSLKEPAIINTNEFAELFAKMSSPAKRKPLSEAYEKKGKAKKIIKLLDGKRSQAVGILISSLHLDMKDIQQAVLMLDNSVVDLDAIEALYENRAQPEELERIRKHYETSDEEQVKLLDKPEQFLYELSRIPEFSLRACCIILQSTFTDAIASIKRKTEIVLHVCKDLLEQDSVKEVLGLVLALGNYMNGGSRIRGQADGFGLDILPKLKDVKSRDNHTSLLDYVVSYYLRNLDENAGTETCIFPLPEPQDVFLAAQVKFEDLSKELRKLGKDLAACEKDVQSVCSQTAQIYIHPFKEKMEAFITTAQNEQIATEHHLIQAQKSFRDLVEYFGLKPRSGEQDVLPGHVFMLWFEFCNDFKTRWKRENKAISKERLKEAQQSVRNITAEKKVETRRVHANGLKERLRQKEASISST